MGSASAGRTSRSRASSSPTRGSRPCRATTTCGARPSWGRRASAPRLGVPGLLLSGGSIAAGKLDGKDITIQHVFEAVGALAAGKIDEQRLEQGGGGGWPGGGARGGPD